MKEEMDNLLEKEEKLEEILVEENEMETNEVSKDEEDLLVKKEKEIEELNTKLARLQADFINFKKRTEKEKETISYYAIEPFVASLLPTIDNLERALESEADKESGFFKGVELIYNEFIKTLNNNKLTEILALHEDFDPNFHHAVYMDECEELDSGKVMEVLQKGYILRDKVVRPSMVKVVK